MHRHPLSAVLTVIGSMENTQGKKDFLRNLFGTASGWLRVSAIHPSDLLRVFFGTSSETSEEIPKRIRRKPEEGMAQI